MGFFDGWFGTDDAKKEVAASGKKQRQSLQAGFDDQEKYFDPYRTGGMHAYNTLFDLSGASGKPIDTNWITQTPGYQFGLDQGIGAIDRSAVGRATGNTMKSLVKFGSDYGKTGFGDAYNRIGAIADRGYDATGRVAGARGDLASGTAGIHRWQGENMANASLASGSNLMSMLGMGANLAGWGMGTGFGVPTSSNVKMGSLGRMPYQPNPWGSGNQYYYQ
jgi:hypothetical protein